VNRAQVNADTARGKLKGQATEWYLKNRAAGAAVTGNSETVKAVGTSATSATQKVLVQKTVVDAAVLKAQEDAAIQVARDAAALAEAEAALKSASLVRSKV
jgi:hypothetical protein